jgi:hypothetical protein
MTDKNIPVIGFAQFFDDIRREDNGKLIAIGMYTGDMVLPPGAPPADRLAILITVKWPLTYTPSSLNVRVEVPGQPPITMADAFEAPRSAPLEAPPSSFAGATLQTVIQSRFPPLRIGDKIDVWLLVDEHEIPAGRLQVVAPTDSLQMNAPQNQSTASAPS